MNAKPEDFVKTAEILLKREVFHARNQVRLDVLNPRFTAEVLPWAADDLVLQLQGYVWAQELQNVTSEATVTMRFKAPASWWQHFKRRWFPAWMKRRWPVRLRVIKKTRTVRHRFECLATHPGFKYEAPPDFGKVVIKTKAWTE